MRSDHSLSPINTDHDQQCCICNRYADSLIDWRNNFLRCNACLHSYHRQCIAPIHRTRGNYCFDRIDINNHQLSCCKDLRRAKLLWKSFSDDEGFCRRNYAYNLDDVAIYWHPDDKKKERAVDKKLNLPNRDDYQLRFYVKYKITVNPLKFDNLTIWKILNFTISMDFAF